MGTCLARDGAVGPLAGGDAARGPSLAGSPPEMNNREERPGQQRQQDLHWILDMDFGIGFWQQDLKVVGAQSSELTPPLAAAHEVIPREGCVGGG
jgi:hypothetical protein